RVVGARGAEIGIVTVLNTFTLGYATATLGMPRQQTIASLLIATVLVLILVPASGALSDRVGRRNVYLLGALAATLLVIPACLLIDSRQAGLLTLGLMLGMLGPGVMTGPQGSFFAELFGVHVRYTGASLGFQLGAALIGGLAPVVAAGVVLATGNLLPVGVFMLGLGLATIACVCATAETYAGEGSHDGQGSAVRGDRKGAGKAPASRRRTEPNYVTRCRGRAGAARRRSNLQRHRCQEWSIDPRRSCRCRSASSRAS